MKYIERLQATDEELNQQQAQARANETRSSLEAKIANQKAQITRLENQAEAPLNNYPLNIDAVINAHSKVITAKETLARLEEVYEQLFGGAE